ncbi:MAG: T9SS type A sorting domain-containing protein [Flavobacteriales bacterium]
MSDANGCTWNSDTVLVVLNTGLGSISPSPVRIMPNPAADEVRVLSDQRVISVTARDVSGRLVPVPMTGPQTFSVAELASGVWVLEVRADDGRTAMTRLVKQ